MLDSDVRCWAVCERSQRWLNAVRRFGPEMTPPPLVLDVVASDRSQLTDTLTTGLPCVILWEIDADSLLSSFQWLVRTATAFPLAIQLVADCGLSPSERLALCELPIAALIQQPEQLPMLGSLIQGHFATLPQIVD